MAWPPIILGFVSMGPWRYPKYEIKIIFELDMFKAQLGSYTSNLIQWVSITLYGMYKHVEWQFYHYMNKIIFLPFKYNAGHYIETQHILGLKNINRFEIT